MRKIQPPAPPPGEHPWLTAFQKDLARQDLAALTVRGYGIPNGPTAPMAR